MSLLAVLLVLAFVSGTCVTMAVAFARAVLYQNVLGELDITRASCRARRDAAPGRRPKPLLPQVGARI